MASTCSASSNNNAVPVSDLWQPCLDRHSAAQPHPSRPIDLWRLRAGAWSFDWLAEVDLSSTVRTCIYSLSKPPKTNGALGDALDQFFSPLCLQLSLLPVTPSWASWTSLCSSAYLSCAFGWCFFPPLRLQQLTELRWLKSVKDLDRSIYTEKQPY